MPDYVTKYVFQNNGDNMATPYNLYRSNTESDESGSITMEQTSKDKSVALPQSVAASTPAPKQSKSTRTTQSDTTQYVINPIREDVGVIVANTNINTLGAQFYRDRASAIQAYASLRVVVPTLGLGLYLVGGRVLKSALTKYATAQAAKAAAQAASAPATSKFAAAAQWAASKINRSQAIKKAGFIGRAIDWGSTAVAVTCSISDLISWYYDALTDFAASHRFMFNEAYTRDDQQRLNALIRTGIEAHGKTSSYYARVTLTPKQVKGFIMLSTEVVTDQPFDLDVAMPMAAAWTTHAEQEASRTKESSDLVVTIYVADPNDPSEVGATNALAEAKVLLMRLTRALDQFADADYENLLVPILLYVSRLSSVPGIITKIGPGFVAGADAVLSTSFEAETDEIQNDMTEGNFVNSSWIDTAADFLNRLFDVTTGGAQNGAD
jgi:hypothetical protein